VVPVSSISFFEGVAVKWRRSPQTDVEAASA
jgi:hypothetical protein